MAKRILFLGLRPDLIQQIREQFDRPGLEVVSGSTLEDLRAALAAGDIDHVFLGGGLDIATRALAVQTVFQLSDRATVHMKDQLSGPQGYVPFAAAVLQGVLEYEPQSSPDAILRAAKPETGN